MPLTAHKPTQATLDLVRALNGRWHGDCAICRCPAHDDQTPSLSIRQGDRTILVTCFAGCDRRSIMRELRRIPLRSHAPPLKFEPPREGNWLRLWREAQHLEGTIGGRYLAARNLAILPPELRFHPRCPLYPRPLTVFYPAIVGAVRSNDALVAIHRTFLDPDTDRVAKVDTPKRALGHLGEGAVRLGGAVASRLGLAEGIETALSATQIFGIPCWATLGNERFGKVAIPDSVTELHLFIDADKGGSLAETRARAAHRRSGRTIFTHCPPIGGQDWNDVLMAAATHDASNPSGGEGGWGG